MTNRRTFRPASIDASAVMVVRCWTAALALASASCGSDDAGKAATDGNSGSSDEAETSGTTTTMTGASTMSTAASNSASNSESTDSSTSVAETADSSTSGAESGSDTSSGGGPDLPVEKCDVRGPTGAETSGYIWISNPLLGTVSKINVHTLLEEGRYLTAPGGGGDPSRTAVNFNGDVAVSNRAGGMTLITPNIDQCPDPNSTSTGPDDVREWPDGCVVWHTPMVYASQRPVAWTAGTRDPADCRYHGMDVWTSGATDSIEVVLLDGETGAIEQIVPIPGVDLVAYGLYNGAVDSGGNFWGSNYGFGHLVRVDRETFTAESWPLHGTEAYGVAVDHNDRVWTCANTAGRFDYETEQWDTAIVGGQGGCNVGVDNIMWMASDPVVAVDIDTMEVVETLVLPEYVHGITVDFDGYVWGVTIGSNVMRVDPVGGGIDVIEVFPGGGGSGYAYTYSDMSGTALAILQGQF